MPFDLRVVTGGGIFDTAVLPACDSVSLEGLKESYETSHNSSLDLISSAWIAIQDGTLASVATLAELTLAWRDSVLR